MKKFSNMTGQKVNEEPKVDVKITEGDLFRSKVMHLMEQFLSCKTCVGDHVYSLSYP